MYHIPFRENLWIDWEGRVSMPKSRYGEFAVDLLRASSSDLAEPQKNVPCTKHRSTTAKCLAVWAVMLAFGRKPLQYN